MWVVARNHTLTAGVSMAWTISRPLCRCGSMRGRWWWWLRATTHRLLLLLHTSEVSHCNLTPIKTVTCALAVVIIVNSTLAHCQRTDLGYLFVTDFRYRLIRDSLLFARFSAAGMGSVYMRECLYASVYSSLLEEETV